MDNEEFLKELKIEAEKIKIELNKEQQEKFYKYMKLLLEWNKKINLTAITEPKDIIIKHFIDSLTILKYTKKQDKIIDIGTGAGFPGIPLKIVGDKLEVTLVDSLNKRVNFLNEVISNLNLESIQAIHGRAEEIGNNKNYREIFDIATSRAVAKLNVLVEYLLPTLKIDGKCICMKGTDCAEEIEEAKTAINVLGGRITSIDEFLLTGTDMKRTIIIIDKIKRCSNKFPRKPGIPVKLPIK